MSIASLDNQDESRARPDNEYATEVVESRPANCEKLDPTSLKPTKAPPEGHARVALEAKNLGGRG